MISKPVEIFLHGTDQDVNLAVLLPYNNYAIILDVGSQETTVKGTDFRTTGCTVATINAAKRFINERG